MGAAISETNRSIQVADMTPGRATALCLPEGTPTMPVRSYVTLPSDDDEFRTTVEQLVAETDDIDRLREYIAAVYPKAYVSAQSPLGSLSGEPTRTYIYRDGSLAKGEP